MTQENFEQLLNVLQNTWDKLYVITLRQVYVDAVRDAIGILFIIATFFVFLYFLKKVIKYRNDYLDCRYMIYEERRSCMDKLRLFTYFQPDEDESEMIMITFIIITVVLLVMSIAIMASYFLDLMTVIANPNWLVIEKLINTFKSIN